MRKRLEAGNGGGRRGVIVGIRPEHFEDASLVTLPTCCHAFTTKIDVLEALGSDSYAHFTAGAAPSADGVQVVARLDAASGIKQGQEAQLWIDTSHVQLPRQEVSGDHAQGGGLPEPDGTTRAISSPSAIARLMSLTASTPSPIALGKSVRVICHRQMRSPGPRRHGTIDRVVTFLP